jgi:hypothetical protein
MEVKIRLFSQLSNGKIHVSTSFDRGGKDRVYARRQTWILRKMGVTAQY